MSAPGIHVQATETGDTPFSVRIEMGPHALIGDEPAELGGGDAGPAPYQLLSAALAECSAMTVRWFARQRGWPLDHVRVEVDWRREVSAGTAKPIDQFIKTVHLRGDALTSEQRARLISVAASCPVHRTLDNTPAIQTIAGG